MGAGVGMWNFRDSRSVSNVSSVVMESAIRSNTVVIIDYDDYSVGRGSKGNAFLPGCSMWPAILKQGVQCESTTRESTKSDRSFNWTVNIISNSGSPRGLVLPSCPFAQGPSTLEHETFTTGSAIKSAGTA